MRSAKDLRREISPNQRVEPSDSHKIRWVTLSHSCFDSDIKNFTQTMNQALQQEKIQFELVKTTAPSIGRVLFNNFDSSELPQPDRNCMIFANEAPPPTPGLDKVRRIRQKIDVIRQKLDVE